jgi:hypothetical protein
MLTREYLGRKKLHPEKAQAFSMWQQSVEHNGDY